jgi:hypothetical protein
MLASVVLTQEELSGFNSIEKVDYGSLQFDKAT